MSKVGGNSGMGLQKHRTSGHTTKSPRFLMQQKIDLQREERRGKGKNYRFYSSIKKLFEEEK